VGKHRHRTATSKPLGTISFKVMRRIITLFFLSVMMISCHKNEDPESSCSSNDWEFNQISSDLKSFFFKKDSYWVFQNDSTKVLDSLYITNTEIGCEAVYLYQGHGYNWEYYKISYASYQTRSRYYDMIEGDMMQRNRHPSKYPSIAGWFLYSSWNDTTNQFLPSTIDSLNVKGNTFYQIQLSHDLFHPNERVDTYTAKGIGIIKKIVYSGSYKGEWNLDRWKIVK
jgi:hypothetical protein